MSKLRTIVFLFFLFNSIVLHAQQELCIVDSISYNYVDCYGDSTGSISLTLLDTDPTYPLPYFGGMALMDSISHRRYQYLICQQETIYLQLFYMQIL